MANSTKPAKTHPKKVNRHPRLYTIFKPNELINAKKFDLNFMELRVYNEILNNNHQSNPDQLVYKVPYEYIFDFEDNGNRMTNVKRIAGQLQRRYFIFDREFMMTVFGDDVTSSINPFPEIVHRKGEHSFEIHLSPKFKKVLTILDHGFTKGDIETLRAFNHEVSHALYWQIRKHQAFAGTWQVDLPELKELLGMEGKYEVWSNFKARVLDIARDEFIGTWVEFDYDAIRKGKGAPVTAILFKFKNTHKQERGGVPAGEDYEWEEKLLAFGIDSNKVIEIRYRVKINEQSEKGFVWDNDYIRFSLEAAKSDVMQKKNNPHISQIQKMGAWVYTGLMDGRWIEYVDKRKERTKALELSQQTFNFETLPGSDDIAKEKVTEKTRAALTLTSQQRKVVLSETEVGYMKDLYNGIPHTEIVSTFEKYMNHNGFYLEGASWTKLYS